MSKKNEDKSVYWNKSNITFWNLLRLLKFGSIVIASSWSDEGLFYSEDNGHTWKKKWYRNILLGGDN